MHCEMWSIDPRAACRMLGERLTPLLLSQVLDAREMSALHRQWQHVDSLQDSDARSKARWRLMTSGSELVSFYMAG